MMTARSIRAPIADPHRVGVGVCASVGVLPPQVLRRSTGAPDPARTRAPPATCRTYAYLGQWIAASHARERAQTAMAMATGRWQWRGKATVDDDGGGEDGGGDDGGDSDLAAALEAAAAAAAATAAAAAATMAVHRWEY